MEQNKTGKYLKYAIGEVVLVVIGILIALSINNWNEANKLNLRIDDLNNRLIQETLQNIKSVESYKESLKSQLDAVTALLLMIGKPIKEVNQIKLDSLMHYALIDFKLNINLNSLSEAKTNGEISLIKNDTLRFSLNEILQYENKTQERINIINSDNNNYLVPYIYKNINFRNQRFANSESFKNRIGYSKLTKSDWNQILSDREFENLLTIRLLYVEGFLSSNQKLTGLLERLKELLYKEK